MLDTVTRPARFAPYVARPIRYAGVVAMNGWRLKWYAISSDVGDDSGPVLDNALISEARARAAATAFALPPGEGDHGAGFVIIHRGRLGTWLLMDWWSGEILLNHQVLRADPGTHAFGPPPASVIACVWELRVIEFERECWTRHMLLAADGPDINAYLAEGLTTMA